MRHWLSRLGGIDAPGVISYESGGRAVFNVGDNAAQCAIKM